jgi:hypothetical protein
LIITFSLGGWVLCYIKDTQNYWVFGLFPSSGILENRKHDVLEAGSVSILRGREEDAYSIGPLRKS